MMSDQKIIPVLKSKSMAHELLVLFTRETMS